MSKPILLYRSKIGEELRIGPGLRPLLIAEAGVLTFGDKAEGFKFVDEAVRAGIKLLKFQCLSPDSIVSQQDKFWLDRLKQRALSQADFLEIMKYSLSQGVVCFASTHNEYDLVTLAQAGMPILKIGSGDSNNFRMIDMALATSRPVILSLGLLRRSEIFKILERYRNHSDQLIIMHCTTIYPTPPQLANLDLIRQMQDKHPEYNFGYSDHVAGSSVILAASAMPAVTIIEKHFCFPEHRVKPKFESLDISAALTTDEFISLLKAMEEIWQATKEYEEDEKVLANRQWAHKAISVRRDLARGQIVQADDLMSIRPFDAKVGHISIENFYSIAGQRLSRDKKKGDYLYRDDIS